MRGRAPSWRVGARNEAICAHTTDRTGVLWVVEGTQARSQHVPSRSDPRSSGVFGSQCGFTDKTGDIQRAGEDIAQKLGFGAIGFAEPGRAFQVSSGLVGVAAFRVTEAPDAQVPGGRTDLEVTGQAHIIVLGKTGIDEGSVTQGMVGVSVWTERNGGMLGIRPVIEQELGCRLRDTPLSTDPFAVLAFVVVTVEGQAVAVRTERIALPIIAAFQASECILVAVVVTDVDRAQGMQVVIDEEQNLIKAFSRIAEHL